GEQSFQGHSALGEWVLEQRLVLQGEQVEGHVNRRRLPRQARPPRAGGVQGLLQRVEVLPPGPVVKRGPTEAGGHAPPARVPVSASPPAGGCVTLSTTRDDPCAV